MTGLTRRIAEFAAGISIDAIPEAVRERTGMLLLDSVGIALRARNDAESTPAMIQAAARLGLDGGRNVVIGERRGFTPAGAALINGTLIHSLDFDDTHAAASLHSSAPIVPAALAAAEMAGADGEELVQAIVAGYEVQIRLSLALGPTDHYDRGFHPTATCGVFGAAAAAGRIFCLDADQMASAFGIALSQAAGSMQFLFDGAWTKRSHVGHAAMSGLMAATLADEGYRGSGEAIEGQWGFLHAYAPAAMPEKATEGLGERWETLGLAVKPFPSCRYSHAAMEALLELRQKHGIDWRQVDAVEIGVPKAGWKIIGEPEATKHNPKSVVDGQFSMAFCAAVALREGGMVWDDYAKHIDDPKTLELCRKVKCAPDQQAEAEFPKTLAGVARITARGETHEAFVAVPKGEPANFLTVPELKAKFSGLVSPYLDHAAVDELAARLLAIDAEGDVAEVLRLTRPRSLGPVEAAADDEIGQEVQAW